MESKQDVIRIVGMPLIWFIVFGVIVFSAAFGTFWPGGKPLLPNSMLGSFSVMVLLGGLLMYLGDNIPIINKYLGGGPIVVIFGAAALVYFKIMPDAIVKQITSFMGSVGFLDWYIGALITGSILGMNRKLLIRAFGGYIPAIMGGVVLALGLAGIVGGVTGFGWKKAVLFVGIPIMGGGMGAGAVPLSKIYATATAGDAAKLLSMMVPAVALGNALAVISAGLLDRLGRVRPSLTGNGQLLVTNDPDLLKPAERAPFQLDKLAIGIALSGALYIVGQMLSLLVPSIHAFAFMIISAALLKVSGVLPSEVESACYYWFQFMTGNLTGALLVGIGVGYTNLGDIIAALTPAYLLMVAATVLGAILGAWFIGKLVGFYPIESAITAGLCMANMGGTGDVATLGAAKRMELMPFAQISSRIGGAIMLIIGSFLIAVLK